MELRCLLVEVITRGIPFQGKSESDIFMSIVDKLGWPPRNLFTLSNRRREFLMINWITAPEP
jgi:hypothetical protein